MRGKRYALHTTVCGYTHSNFTFIPSFGSRFDKSMPRRGRLGWFYIGITEITPHPGGNPYGSWWQVAGLGVSINTPSEWLGVYVVFRGQSHGINLPKRVRQVSE